jgi:hypothetical protein
MPLEALAAKDDRAADNPGYNELERVSDNEPTSMLC